MSIYESVNHRIQSKEFRKSLEELYGADAVGAQKERYASLTERFAQRDAASAAGEQLEGEARFYSAPGRTELGGNHTDHNHGRVLCAAVDLDAVACVLPRDNKEAHIVSEGWKDPITVDLSDLEPKEAEKGSTAALVRGVAKGLSLRDIEARGFDALIQSNVLPGSGLSSSAAIEVLLGQILSDLAGTTLDPVEIAKIGQFAENKYFGKPCGLMDQTACAVGGVISIDFADPERPRVHKVNFDLEGEGYVLAIVNTGGSHADLTPDYAAVPAEMLAVAEFLGSTCLREVEPSDLVMRGPEIRKACGDRALLRALHFVGENARVGAMVDALTEGKLKAYLKLVKKSGDSSWKLLQNLYPSRTPDEQGLCLAVALSQDYIGKRGAARVHGGGFAGTIQAYLPRELFEGWKALMERYFGPGSVMPVKIRGKGVTRVL
jgi:galactokinase